MHGNLKAGLYGYFFVIGLFLLIISPNFLTEGMFMDGVNYAAVSRNLSNNLGSFWIPYYNKTVPFYSGCSPLCFGIQSLFYRVLGDSFIVEKIFSVFNFILIGYLIIKIWIAIDGSLNKGWVPLLFFCLMPLTTWSATNNILENSMTVFVLCSILFLFEKN